VAQVVLDIPVGPGDLVDGPDVLIDLGELDLLADDPVEDGWVALRRRQSMVAIVLSCLVLVTGAAPLRPDLSTPLWILQSRPSSLLFAGGSVAYLVEPRPGAALLDASTVSALDAGTGRVLWRTPVAGAAPDRIVGLSSDVDAIVLVRPPSGPDEAALTRTMFLSRRTDQVLATAPGQPVRATGRLAVLEQTDASCPDGSSECDDLSAVDLDNGAVAWRLTLPAQSRVVASGAAGPDAFVTADADGAITLRALATGVPMRSAPGQARGGGGVRLSAAAGGVLVVAYPTVLQTQLTGYRGADLDPLWSVSLPRDPGPGRLAQASLVGLRTCGDLVCVRDGGGTAIIDPGRGRLLFRTPLSILTQVGGGVFLGLPYLGRLDQFGRFITDVPTVDPGTGRVVSVVRNGTPVDVGSETRVAAGLVRRVVVERTTSFAAVDPSGATTDLFGVSGTDLGCVVGMTLVCVDDAGLVRAWRVTV
jgi:hypothetical protein